MDASRQVETSATREPVGSDLVAAGKEEDAAKHARKVTTVLRRSGSE
jgi:hypothetical protein